MYIFKGGLPFPETAREPEESDEGLYRAVLRFPQMLCQQMELLCISVKAGDSVTLVGGGKQWLHQRPAFVFLFFPQFLKTSELSLNDIATFEGRGIGPRRERGGGEFVFITLMGGRKQWL